MAAMDNQESRAPARQEAEPRKVPRALRGTLSLHIWPLEPGGNNFLQVLVSSVWCSIRASTGHEHRVTLPGPLPSLLCEPPPPRLSKLSEPAVHSGV